MRISAFCLISNPTKFGYPWLESIRSFARAVDELVVIDGGSTDGALEAIEELKDPKIRVVSDERTKWEDDWSYERMGINFNIGYHECRGDFVVKFDADYVLHESALNKNPSFGLRAGCERAEERGSNAIITFTRLNFTLVDRFNLKVSKTFAVNRIACKKMGFPVDYGLDLERWGRGYEPIVADKEINGVKHGALIKKSSRTISSNIKVCNYGFCFSTKEQINWVRNRHLNAEARFKDPQGNPKYTKGYEEQKDRCVHIFKTESQVKVPFDFHPDLIKEKILNLKPTQQGYDFFGELERAKYYI